MDAKTNNVKLVDSKEKDENMVNSNDKVAKIVDSKVSTKNNFNKIDTVPVDPIALEKRSFSNTKIKPAEVKDSDDVAKKEVKKRGGALKK